ncbi:MAG: TilS substrate-binding domain-containing protein, partial [Actinomycetaceae bacterium]
TAEQARRDDDALTAGAGTLLEEAILAAEGRPATDGPLVLDTATLAAAHPALRSRALREAGERAGWRPGDVKAAHLAALDALVTDYRGQGPAALPGGVAARRACGRLTIGRSDDGGTTWT